MGDVKIKYRAQEKEAFNGAYRLTLTAAAFARVVAKGSKPLSGFVTYPRIDGQWDVFVSPATADLLQQRGEGEHLTDVVERLLKEDE